MMQEIGTFFLTPDFKELAHFAHGDKTYTGEEVPHGVDDVVGDSFGDDVHSVVVSFFLFQTVSGVSRSVADHSVVSASHCHHVVLSDLVGSGLQVFQVDSFGSFVGSV